MIESEKSKILTILSRIPPDVAQDEWISVAYSIYNILNEDYEESFKIFNEWSSKGEKYKGEKDVRTRFNSIQKARKTSGGHKYRIKNLNDLANKYNPIVKTSKKDEKKSEDEEMTEEEKAIFTWLYDNLETAEHVKHIVFGRKKDEFMWILDGGDERAVYTEGYSNFYCFENGRWYNHAEKLFKYIKYDLYNECFLKYESIRDKLTKGQDTRIRSRINNLLEPTFQMKVLECSKSDDFTKRTNIKFDERPELLGFDNGVLDLKTGLFREYKYDDYISMSVGWDYQADEEGKPIIDPSKVEDLYQYLHSMFRSEEEREVLDYLLNMYASSLNGYTYRKFFILTGQAFGGGGSNGKSKLNENHCGVLGKYALENPKADLLFGNKTGPSPELVAIEKKRYIRFQEPDSKQSFSVEFIQALCGGSSKMSARNCYSNKTSITISGTVSCECNKTPDFPSNNNASRDRLAVIPYRTIFSTGLDGALPIDNKTVFPATSTNTKEWFYERRMEWISILLPFSMKLLETPLEFRVSAPKIVIDASAVYLSKSNIVNQWFDNNYEKCADKDKDGKSVILEMKDVYEEFKESLTFKEMSKKEKRDTSYENFCGLFMLKSGFKNEWKIKLKEPYKNALGELIKGRHYGKCMIGWCQKKSEKMTEMKEDDEEFDEEE